MKVLVIYDLLPETSYRAIVDMTEEEYTFFSKAHSVYVNFEEENEEGIAASNVIGQAFITEEKYRQYCSTDKEREYFGKWQSDLGNTYIVGVKRLICTGFYL